MLGWITRSVISKHKHPLNRLSSSLNHGNWNNRDHKSDQIDFLNSIIEGNSLIEGNRDWSTIKTQVISQSGSINQKNFEGVLLKLMVTQKKYDLALSFVNHLRDSNEDMTIGSINGILGLYYEIGKTRKLLNEEKTFILDTYKNLYEKHKILDCFTCEKLVRVLCVIDEWEKAFWTLQDIYITSIPSHTAYSVLIGTLFRNNKKKKAYEMINESMKHKRPLQYEAFEEWMNFILRKYKDRKAILKQLGEIHGHIDKYYAVVDENTARKLKEIYCNLGWDAEFTKIRRINGECIKCKETLDCLKLSNEDFTTLQTHVKEKLIIGSDLFLKSSPDELKNFLSFIEKTAPYDIVIDALNVAYAVGKGMPVNRIEALGKTIDYFKARNKRILLLGRKHMLGWGRGKIQRLMSSNYTFFTDDLSQDDPYFITAAIMSGPNTDIVSKDLLRGHQFNLQDENLRYLFKKWQWQHQWMVFMNFNRNIKIQAPMAFTPCAQKNENNGGWHLPYQSEATKVLGQVNDGTPDLSSWICIRRKENK